MTKGISFIPDIGFVLCTLLTTGIKLSSIHKFTLHESTSQIPKYLTLSLVEASDILPSLCCTSDKREAHQTDLFSFIQDPEMWANCNNTAFKARKEFTRSCKRKTALSVYKMTLWARASIWTPEILWFARTALANVSFTKSNKTCNKGLGNLCPL